MRSSLEEVRNYQSTLLGKSEFLVDGSARRNWRYLGLSTTRTYTQDVRQRFVGHQCTFAWCFISSVGQPSECTDLERLVGVVFLSLLAVFQPTLFLLYVENVTYPVSAIRRFSLFAATKYLAGRLPEPVFHHHG